MSRRTITTLTLTKERAEQLKMIAAANNLAVSALLVRFIQSEIKKGTIPNEIPGYRIKRVRRHIEIGIASATIHATSDEANAIAKGLEEIAGDPVFWAQTRIKDKRTFNAAYGDEFIKTKEDDIVLIRRRGRGLIIETHKAGKRPVARRSLSPDIAYDLAKLIRAAAKSERQA